MIVFQDVMERLSNAGYSAYRFQKEKLIPSSTMDRIRHNGPISTETIDTVCRLCDCQPGDLMLYVPDPEE